MHTPRDSSKPASSLNSTRVGGAGSVLARRPVKDPSWAQPCKELALSKEIHPELAGSTNGQRLVLPEDCAYGLIEKTRIWRKKSSMPCVFITSRTVSVAVTAFDKATVVAKSGFESQWSQTTLHSNLLYKVL